MHPRAAAMSNATMVDEYESIDIGSMIICTIAAVELLGLLAAWYTPCLLPGQASAYPLTPALPLCSQQVGWILLVGAVLGDWGGAALAQHESAEKRGPAGDSWPDTSQRTCCAVVTLCLLALHMPSATYVPRLDGERM